MMVTPLYGGLLTVLFIVLSLRVIHARRGRQVTLGDGGNPGMLRIIRGHANFVEYVPLALVLMAILEISRFSIYVLHALGILLVAGRLLHGYALSFAEHSKFGRAAGAGLTIIVLLVEGVLCLYQAWVAHSVWFRI